jgi:hypothetical protein
MDISLLSSLDFSVVKQIISPVLILLSHLQTYQIVVLQLYKVL